MHKFISGHVSLLPSVVMNLPWNHYRFRVPPANVSYCALEGETVKINCRFTYNSLGLPDPIVTPGNASEVVFENATSELSGDYSCGYMHPCCGLVEDVVSIMVYGNLSSESSSVYNIYIIIVSLPMWLYCSGCLY